MGKKITTAPKGKEQADASARPKVKKKRKKMHYKQEVRGRRPDYNMKQSSYRPCWLIFSRVLRLVRVDRVTGPGRRGGR